MVAPKPESASIANPIMVFINNQNDISMGENNFRTSGKTNNALPKRTKYDAQDIIVGLLRILLIMDINLFMKNQL